MSLISYNIIWSNSFLTDFNFKPFFKKVIDDPKTMKATDKCLTCYKSTVKVKCTGALIRSKPWNWGTDANTWVTAKTCIAQKGQCCSGGSKTFNPNSSPNEIFCNNCYSGAATSSGCSGKLLASADFTPSVCVAFGGQCCDGDFAGMFQIYSLELNNTWRITFFSNNWQVPQRVQLSQLGQFLIHPSWKVVTCVTMDRLFLRNSM